MRRRRRDQEVATTATTLQRRRPAKSRPAKPASISPSRWLRHGGRREGHALEIAVGGRGGELGENFVARIRRVAEDVDYAVEIGWIEIADRRIGGEQFDFRHPRALRLELFAPRVQGGAMLPLTQNGAPAQMPAAGDVLAFEALRPRALNKGTNDRGREYETV